MFSFFFPPRRENLICGRCRQWHYLTSIEIRFYDQENLARPAICRRCKIELREEAERERAAQAAEAARSEAA